MGTELFEALRAADPRTPSELEVFDRIAASDELRPDFYEHSLRLREGGSHRLTYYFDVHRRGSGVAREAGARFVELARALGFSLSPALSAFVQADARGGDEVLQVVLGIDVAPDGASTRAKYYLVFRGNPQGCLIDLFGAVDIQAPAGAALGDAYIAAVDATGAGVDDVKLYFRLKAHLVPNVVDNAGDVAGLLNGSRDIVFQQCTRRPQRRQLYLHMRSSAVLSEWLARRGFDQSLARAGSINARLRGAHIDPWIVSFAYARRRLDVDDGTVYFHLAY